MGVFRRYVRRLVNFDGIDILGPLNRIATSDEPSINHQLPATPSDCRFNRCLRTLATIAPRNESEVATVCAATDSGAARLRIGTHLNLVMPRYLAGRQEVAVTRKTVLGRLDSNQRLPD